MTTPPDAKPSLAERIEKLADTQGYRSVDRDLRAIAAELREIAALQHSYCDHYDPLAPHAFIDMIRKWADRLAKREP